MILCRDTRVHFLSNLAIGVSEGKSQMEPNLNRQFDSSHDHGIGIKVELPRGIGRGRAATLPAWMTSQQEVPPHSDLHLEPLPHSQHSLTFQPPLPPGPPFQPPLPLGPPPVLGSNPLLPPVPTMGQASRHATRRGTRAGRNHRRGNHTSSPPTTQPITPHNASHSPGPDTFIFHPGAGFVAGGAMQYNPLVGAYPLQHVVQVAPHSFSPVYFLHPSVNVPPDSLCYCGFCCGTPASITVGVHHGVIFSGKHSYTSHY